MSGNDWRQGIHGQVDRFASAWPLAAATDASWRRGTRGRASRGGMGYVVSDGRWGLRGWLTGVKQLDPNPQGELAVAVQELRAVDLLLATGINQVTIYLDSAIAIAFLTRWRGGDVDAMPDGYRLRPRLNPDGPTPTLVRLAGTVSGRDDLDFVKVAAHTGHPLNEAADTLASIACRLTEEHFDAASRAHGVVDAFVGDWHRARQSASGLTP